MKSMLLRDLHFLSVIIGAMVLFGNSTSASAAGCDGLPSHGDLKNALTMANDGIGLTLNNQMWGAVVSDDGTVCAVAFTGDDNLQSQWLASRVISAQKANTANSLSLGNNSGGANAGLALSTANL